MLDSASPRVGSKLSERGYNVIGTIEHTLMATNMNKRLKEEIERIDTNEYQLIYIDVTISQDREEYVSIIDRPVMPGGGVGKDIPPLGEWFIGMNVYDGESPQKFANGLLSEVYGKARVDVLVDMCYESIITALEELENERDN
jgi:hypothetical protein